MTEEELRFCVSCGHEGNDVICPVCGENMESLEEEMERISKMENEKSDIFDEDELSLEQERENETDEDIQQLEQ